MNNLEWLYENDRETLIAMIEGACENCKFDDMCENVSKGTIKCAAEWLNAEHEEPDSWEKIEADAIGLSQVLNESYSCPADITNKIVDLVLRCEKLMGVD